MRKLSTILTLALFLSLISCCAGGGKHAGYYYVIEVYSGGELVKEWNATRARHFREGVKFLDKQGNEIYVTGTFSVTRYKTKG